MWKWTITSLAREEDNDYAAIGEGEGLELKTPAQVDVLLERVGQRQLYNAALHEHREVRAPGVLAAPRSLRGARAAVRAALRRPRGARAALAPGPCAGGARGPRDASALRPSSTHYCTRNTTLVNSVHRQYRWCDSLLPTPHHRDISFLLWFSFVGVE